MGMNMGLASTWLHSKQQGWVLDHRPGSHKVRKHTAELEFGSLVG